ncbi:mannose-1-phosphate guanylyltransferase/mannose-6-phosphate isomerase [Aquibium sp. A9E412]|uniref:mannose-1-phosphate guanylyltransferase/mannose-6-phosphate isomerase n=1 Tax=Aquibium sp. A9E412 TaxID=2976767 RepID=UPI0025AEEF17|nr:mannose-1-phosphate guanylyltransferase/mannose-6-phosphate isomerase [Aquibium sp. A9E412]MDN2566086.1 mannose-1-phosphate guanylyltransferase/mannose-6-phosphate isomerase [Aquibium sp. A9E412]
MLVPVVMAGGSGTRLWPVSRKLYPKQFCALTGERTMLQETAARLSGLDAAAPLVVCNEEHRFLAAEQLRQIGQDAAAVILEPVGRNTAPAIALAALHATAGGEDPLLLVLAADHLIVDVAAFQASVAKAVRLAEAGRLVTFGIVPQRAETGYGYVRRGAPLGDDGHAVDRFEEKPDAATAEAFVASGDYYWNSGMFLFRAGVYLGELERHAPAILAACRAAYAGAAVDMDFVRVAAGPFAAGPSDSIDYAVMEKTGAAAVVPLDAGWSDIGSWDALWEISDKDAAGNVLAGDVLALDARNSLVRADRRLVALVGVEDLVVVETPDAVLVADRARAQDVKKIVETIGDNGRAEHLTHRIVYRPWGHYDSIDLGDRHQVKRITVKPGAKLSVQMHHHRAEHWVVVRGTARVQKGEETVLLGENQSTYIPLGEVHALENPGKIPLELIEVQSGSYLGEDDIVRLEDRYGRLEKG